MCNAIDCRKCIRCDITAHIHTFMMHNKTQCNKKKEKQRDSRLSYRVNHFSARICSARCPNPTVGDWRASANAAKVGLGSTIFSQAVSMALKQSFVSALSFLIVSNVPGSMSSSKPMLYHCVLASHAAL